MLRVLLSGLILLGIAGPSHSAPKVTPKEQEAIEKAIKDHVKEVVVAIGKQDITALLDLSDVPFNTQPGRVEKDKTELGHGFRMGLGGKAKYDAKHEIKSLMRFEKAKPRFLGR